MNITDFEQRVLNQQAVGAGHYDAEYFTGDWRDAGNNYSLETRRQIEAKNPFLIKDVFSISRRAAGSSPHPRFATASLLAPSRIRRSSHRARMTW
jgi:hypothetical protein